MSLKKLLMLVVLVLIVGGFGYVAITDVDIPQETVTKTISNDNFYKDE